MTTRADLMRKLEETREQIAALDRIGPEPPDGSVIRWRRTFEERPNRTYTYVALRVGDKWYVTGSFQHTLGISWELVVLDHLDAVKEYEAVAAWRAGESIRSTSASAADSVVGLPTVVDGVDRFRVLRQDGGGWTVVDTEEHPMVPLKSFDDDQPDAQARAVLSAISRNRNVAKERRKRMPAASNAFTLRGRTLR